MSVSKSVHSDCQVGCCSESNKDGVCAARAAEDVALEPVQERLALLLSFARAHTRERKRLSVLLCFGVCECQCVRVCAYVRACASACVGVGVGACVLACLCMRVRVTMSCRPASVDSP